MVVSNPNSKIQYLDVEERNLMRNYFYEDAYHLIGDKAYPLKRWILTPYNYLRKLYKAPIYLLTNCYNYRDIGNLTQRQRFHNTCHSRTRIVIEHTFGLVNSRWKILHFVNVYSAEKAIRIIAACCLLHNFCYINSDFWDSYELVNYDDDNYVNDDVQQDGIHKRTEITNLLWGQ